MILDLFSSFDPCERLSSHSSSGFIVFGLLSVLILPKFYCFWSTFCPADMLISIFLINTGKRSLTTEINNNLVVFSYLVDIIFRLIFFRGFLRNFFIRFTQISHIFWSFMVSFTVVRVGLLFFFKTGINFILKILVPKNIPFLLVWLIVVAEVVQVLIRWCTLAIRLTANMVAGHIITDILNQLLDPL